ncbi:MAG: M23 family metallopeptidase, partial [Actinobacteria bacterium]|nr:M23 family metallopeptidase [Actinomycetota bacterium]
MSLLLILLGPTIASPAAAARARYRRPVDITFPTRRSASYSNDYRAARTGHIHRATDLFARHRTPVFAAKGGRVVWLPKRRHPTAGYSIWVQGRDGRTYAYYHLGRDRRSRRSAYRKGLRQGAFVRRGSRIGYIGSSGNASMSSPHLHFEIHGPKVRDPWGGNRINPYFSLRRAERRGNYSRGRGPGSDQRRRGRAHRRRGSRAHRRGRPSPRRVRRARSNARQRRAR